MVGLGSGDPGIGLAIRITLLPVHVDDLLVRALPAVLLKVLHVLETRLIHAYFSSALATTQSYALLKTETSSPLVSETSLFTHMMLIGCAFE